ncbi:MAG: HEAT repeat domain-containing protein, partial [Cyanobacteria bacterium REEB498]|nr:HEAT repeat domain-containing protein [Cyanobacteria bacterium REEB498]
LLQLERQFQAGGTERRRAMATCGTWGHRAALPLIQRGLRDADPQVSRLAAAAMDRFRGRSGASSPTGPQPAAKPPRNVSRTR